MAPVVFTLPIGAILFGYFLPLTQTPQKVPEFLTGLGLGRYGVLALLMVMVVELGLIHPPVGMNIFVIKSVIEDGSIATIFYGVLPFIVTDLVRLVLLIAFPMIALWLPSQM